MSKVLPAIKAPGSAKFPTKGPHNPNVGTRGSGMAPKPKGGIPVLGNDRPSAGASAGLARAGSEPNSGSGSAGSAGSFLPVQKPQAGLANQRTGQQNPQTSAAATKKPKRRGIGAAFYGEY